MKYYMVIVALTVNSDFVSFGMNWFTGIIFMNLLMLVFYILKQHRCLSLLEMTGKQIQLVITV